MPELNPSVKHGDAFLGYTLAKLEEATERHEWLLVRIDRKQDAIQTLIVNLGKKIDAIGGDLNPTDRASILAQLNQEALRITAATDALGAVTQKLGQTGV